jgi:hypothetical protein
MSTYNGWTNFETWRVNLEIFDGMTPEDISPDGNVDADYLRSYVEGLLDITFQDAPGGEFVHGWVLSWLSDVNWDEIAEALGEDS